MLQLFILILQVILKIPAFEAMIKGWVKAAQDAKDAADKERREKQIDEAASATRDAKTKEDRINAAKKWQDALRNSRVEPGPQ